MPTGKRPPKGAKPGLSQPKMPQSDRLLIRDFSRWLHRQPEIAAPTPEDESGLFTELLKAARHQGINLRTPGGVEELVTLLVASDDSTESDGVNAALATLHEYVHFRAETSTDPSGWDAIHDIFDDAGHGTDWLGAVIEASEQLAPQVRLSALTATLLVGSVSKLLGWIGAGRTVAPSGGVRRVDIAEASGLLGIDAVGVDKLPPYAPDMPALFEIESAPRHTALKVRSMLDVPLLPSWWVALIASEIIEVKGSRVRPGPAAASWMAQPTPPLEAAENLVGITVAEYLCEDLSNRSAVFAGEVAAVATSRLFGALGPSPGPPIFDEAVERLLDFRVTQLLQRLERVGVLASDVDGFVVPEGLRGPVAHGLRAAIVMLTGGLDTIDPDALGL